jgi:signal transduction histidine kinase
MQSNLEEKGNEQGPEYNRAEFKRRLEEEGEIRSLEAPWRKKDGTVIYIHEHAKVLRDKDGKPLYYEGSVEDISDRKRIEQAKSELISLVSHELRVPLTSIVGSLEWMSTTMAEQLPPTARKMVDIAYKSSERMVRLINELLDMDRIESGKIHFLMQPMDLTSLVVQAIESTQPFAQQYGVQILMEQVPPIKVVADSDRLMQVLTNLLSNATKFSPLNGTVQVAMSRNNGDVRVSISDRGRGIPQEFQDRIFQKFAQAAGLESRQKGGAGLGLSISKAIMEKMGGQIGFQSQLNAGTTFYFDLPESPQ